MPRLTIKKVNETIAKHGYELVKGNGYFHYAPLDVATHEHLYDSMVCTYLLNDLPLNDWEEILLDKIEESKFH